MASPSYYVFHNVQVIRVHQAEQSGLDVIPVNLAAPFHKSLAEASFYNEFLLQRRVQMAKDFGLDLTRLVVDGNLKLAPRICGGEVAELVHSPLLKAYTVSPCSRAPCRKRKRCALHAGDLNPAARGPAPEEAVVSHCRLRRLLSAPCTEPYEVLVKPIDAVLAGCADQYSGRWASSTSHSSITTGRG